eukprot:jgi/Psemu1/67945/estExt_Genemark1.C_4000015
MKVGTVATIAAMLPALVSSFVVQPQRSTSTRLMAGGFGKSEDKAPKEKSAAQMERERAGSKYDEIATSGGQEYSIFVRQFGGEDDSWLPCGSIAVARGDQVSNAIFSNEEALKTAIVRTFPKLQGYEQEFEYGYNMKIYPDEPVEVAVKTNASSGPSLGNWFSNLLSPVDASSVKPQQ